MAQADERVAAEKKARVVRQEAFLEMLALTANVSQSAAAAGWSSQGAYRERARSAAFRKKWMTALGEGFARLEMKMLQRALGQAEELPEQVKRAKAGTKEPSDRIILVLLSAHRATVEKQAAATGRGKRTDEDPRVTLTRKLRNMRAAEAAAK